MRILFSLRGNQLPYDDFFCVTLEQNPAPLFYWKVALASPSAYHRGRPYRQGRTMVRVSAIILIALGSLLPAVVSAQEQAPRNARGGYRGLTPEDMNAYCFWNGNLFSVGASFCYRQNSATTCTENAGKRPIWVNKDNDKLCEKSASAMPL
jgi:hypothetical protein